MEVWRALVVGRIARRRRARVRRRRNAEEHERRERLDKDVQRSRQRTGSRNVPERATQATSAAQATRAEDARKDETQLWFGIWLRYQLLYPRPV